MENNSNFAIRKHEEHNNLEKYVLASILQGAELPRKIKLGMFRSTKNRIIYNALIILKETCHPDINVLYNYLNSIGELELAGGADYIAGLTSLLPSSCNIEYYASKLVESYCARSFDDLLAITQEERANGKTLDNIIEEFPKKIHEIFSEYYQNNYINILGISFNDLIRKEFPLAVWVVENLITIGLTVLYGASKIGKSWFALQLVVAIDQGTNFIDLLETHKMGVLYLALEDTEARIKTRLGKYEIKDFNKAYLITDWKNNTSSLKQYLLDNTQIKTVVIDTLQKFLQLNDISNYNETVNALSTLKSIADELAIAIIVIHHTRKGNENNPGDWMDGGLGSMGINATADCSICLTRKRDSNEGYIKATGRDIEDKHLALKWDKESCIWSMIGDVPKEQFLPLEQLKIYYLMKELDGQATTSLITEKTGKSEANVINLLNKLVKIGLVIKIERGLWAIAEFTS